jgi:hypothetical protein
VESPNKQFLKTRAVHNKRPRPTVKPDMVGMSIIPALGRLRHKDLDFKVRLCHTVRYYVKKQTNKTTVMVS